MNEKTNVNQKAEKIEAIRQKYMAQLLLLEKKQSKIIKEFIKALEAKKIDQLRKKINSL
mgnify:CR=1 FL=1